MSIWLILTPAIAWVIALSVGRNFIRSSAEDIWRGSQPFRTEPFPYDPSQFGQRLFVQSIRAGGWLLVAFAMFISLMALLVAAGVVPPANSQGAL